MGITRRDYFAAAALQGLLANPDYDMNIGERAAAAVKNADSLCGALKADPDEPIVHGMPTEVIDSLMCVGSYVGQLEDIAKALKGTKQQARK